MGGISPVHFRCGGARASGVQLPNRYIGGRYAGRYYGFGWNFLRYRSNDDVRFGKKKGRFGNKRRLRKKIENMPWKNKFNLFKNWLLKTRPWLYSFFFDVPWYRITTVISAYWLFVQHGEINKLQAENLALSKIKTEMIISDNEHQKTFDELPFSLIKRMYKNKISRITYANKSFEHEFLNDHGLDRYDVIGKPIIYFWPYETSSIDQMEDNEIALSGERKFFSKKYLDIDSTIQNAEYYKWRKIVEGDTIIVQFFTHPYK